MTTLPEFDPFHNRQCRNIRNALSESFIDAVQQKTLAPVRDQIERFKLEQSWHSSSGDEKCLLQALIRSAGAFLLLESGRTNGARKLAAKALAGLKPLQSQVPNVYDVQGLIENLTHLDSNPPRFGC
ncbi:MAG: DUF309 domain-containing protein [Deltaproteobacteria bacterium]